jgi:hypothetical protein
MTTTKPTRTERYRQQKARVDALRKTRADSAPYRVQAGADDDGTSAHDLLAGFEREDADEIAALQAPVTVSAQEVSELLKTLHARWDRERMGQLLGDCRNHVRCGINGAFGLDRPAEMADKETDDVPTIHDTRTKKAKMNTRAVIKGAVEAGKQDLQQSIGMLLNEFLTVSFDEIMDAYKCGMRADTRSTTFIEALRIRLERIARRVEARWKDVLSAFKTGALSGFLNNLVTMLVKMLVGTGKRIVRVMREGVMAILSALKLALCPPRGMTRAEAGDTALKLVGTTMATSLGVLAEDAAEKAIGTFFATHAPLLVPSAPPVAAALVATMTGIASVLLVYWLERLDLFNVRREHEHEMTLKELDRVIVDGDKRLRALYTR